MLEDITCSIWSDDTGNKWKGILNWVNLLICIFETKLQLTLITSSSSNSKARPKSVQKLPWMEEVGSFLVARLQFIPSTKPSSKSLISQPVASCQVEEFKPISKWTQMIFPAIPTQELVVCLYAFAITHSCEGHLTSLFITSVLWIKLSPNLICSIPFICLGHHVHFQLLPH